MANWPTYLPAPMVSGFDSTADDPILRTNMEAGAPRTRRLFSAVPDNLTLSWVFTLAEMALFESWHKLEALDGAAWFSISLPNGLGMQSVEAKFSKPVRKGLRGGMNWHVSGEVKVRNAPTMTQEYLDVALAYDPNEIVYGSSVLHALVNTTLPSANYW